jgi:hypothetical protein
VIRGVWPRAVRYGIAISETRLLAACEAAGREELWTRELSPPGTAEWPELLSALTEFRAFVGNDPSIVSVALLPALSQVRAIELPFMRRSELLSVLQRDAPRFFLRVRDEQVVAIRHLRRSRNQRSVMAAAASTWLIELLVAELARGSTRLRQIVPAHAAWASSNASTRKSARHWLRVPWAGVQELLEIHGGELRQVRRARVADDDELVSQITGAVTSQLASVPDESTAMLLAARQSGRTHSLAFVAPSVEAEAHLAARRQARWLLSAAAGLMAATGLLRLIDLNRELAHVRATRREIAADVSQMVQRRDDLTLVERLVTRLCEIREAAPRLSNVFVTIATHLPLEAHLLRLSSSGDSVALDGATSEASAVLDELRTAPGVRSVHASAPLRVETNPGEDPTHYFSIVLRLSPAADLVKHP